MYTRCKCWVLNLWLAVGMLHPLFLQVFIFIWIYIFFSVGTTSLTNTYTITNYTHFTATTSCECTTFKDRYTQPRCACAALLTHGMSLAHSKLIFRKHTTNHSCCENRLDIIFNAEQFTNTNLNVKTHPNCTQYYSLCVRAKTDKIWFAVCSCNNSVACVRSPIQTGLH